MEDKAECMEAGIREDGSRTYGRMKARLSEMEGGLLDNEAGLWEDCSRTIGGWKHDCGRMEAE